MTRVLAAEDQVRPQPPVADALQHEVPSQKGSRGLEVRELDLPWPDEPMSRVAEVEEASGSEEQMIEAMDGVGICVTHIAPLTEKILDASPGLRLFCISRGGPVNANLEAAAIVAADVGRYLRGEELAHCANPGALRRAGQG